MNDLWQQFLEFLTVERLMALVRAGVLLVVGLLVSRALAGLAGRIGRARLEPLRARMLRRIVFYTLLLLFVAAAASELGFSVWGIILGTGGVLAIALGFASQTTVANLISGIFLTGERPFDIGDIVRVGGTTGEVLSIDLLSVKLRTFDNVLVRIPNETMLKTEVQNVTRFPIRRVDLQIGVSYSEDLETVRQILLRCAEQNPLCLEQPEPLIILIGFGSSSMDLQFSVWAARESYLELKNTIQEEIKRAFDAGGIEIPFPHVTLAVGKATRPVPLEWAGGGPVEPTTREAGLDVPD